MDIDPRSFSVTLVTAPDIEVARKIAQALLHARLVACANLLPRVESFYWWEGKLEHAEEVMIVLKSTAALSEELKLAIRAHHPYTTPEIISLSLADGSENYLRWILESVASKSTLDPECKGLT